MDAEGRIYGRRVDIDPGRVRDFYAARSSKRALNTDAPVVLSGDRDPALIDTWTRFEEERWLPRLKLDAESRVLEPGCGTGRIARYLSRAAGGYVGVEGVSELCDIARRRTDIDQSRCAFLNLPLEQAASWARIGAHCPFNRFVIGGGVFMYLNDEAVSLCVERSLSMFAERGVYYLSEPVSLIGKRLTLDGFFSEALKAEYNAIYRTPEEYRALLEPLTGAGFRLVEAREMFDEDFKGQRETRQYVFLLER